GPHGVPGGVTAADPRGGGLGRRTLTRTVGNAPVTEVSLMATDSDRATKTHPTLMITVATVGFAVNVIAWVLVGALGERLGDRYGLGPVSRAAVVALPLVVGSLGRIPVGMLTDRYGARLMFPLVSLVTGGAVLLLGVAGSALALAAVAVALGVAGTAFAVGAALVGRCSSPERRGFGLSVSGAGIGGGAV